MEKKQKRPRFEMFGLLQNKLDAPYCRIHSVLFLTFLRRNKKCAWQLALTIPRKVKVSYLTQLVFRQILLCLKGLLFLLACLSPSPSFLPRHKKRGNSLSSSPARQRRSRAPMGRVKKTAATSMQTFFRKKSSRLIQRFCAKCKDVLVGI